MLAIRYYKGSPISNYKLLMITFANFIVDCLFILYLSNEVDVNERSRNDQKRNPSQDLEGRLTSQNLVFSLNYQVQVYLRYFSYLLVEHISSRKQANMKVVPLLKTTRLVQQMQIVGNGLSILVWEVVSLSQNLYNEVEVAHD